jgi:hypothetical protein
VLRLVWPLCCGWSRAAAGRCAAAGRAKAGHELQLIGRKLCALRLVRVLRLIALRLVASCD